MKKICTLFLVLLMSMISACNFDESSRQNSIESVHETSTVESNKKTAEKETVDESVQTEQVIPTTISKVKKLNLGEVDEHSFFAYSKFIYFTDYGRYYPVEIGGRNSANYVLCFNGGDNVPEILTETEDSIVTYLKGNSLYIKKSLIKQGKIGQYMLYELVGSKLTVIDEYPFECGKYYIGNYIYYSSRNDDVITIYRMNQNKSNPEAVIDLPEGAREYIIYDNKIWYDFNKGQGISYYDLTTGETKSFDKGKIGIINNGYMYYTYYEEPDKLLRFNLSSHEYEIVCETKDNKRLFAFDFHKEDYVLYSSDSCLYKMNDDENTLIFSAENFFENEGYEIRNIQCQDNHIYILIGSGAFYQCIMEIDIDGNVIEIIHED